MSVLNFINVFKFTQENSQLYFVPIPDACQTVAQSAYDNDHACCVNKPLLTIDT